MSVAPDLADWTRPWSDFRQGPCAGPWVPTVLRDVSLARASMRPHVVVSHRLTESRRVSAMALQRIEATTHTCFLLKTAGGSSISSHAIPPSIECRENAPPARPRPDAATGKPPRSTCKQAKGTQVLARHASDESQRLVPGGLLARVATNLQASTLLGPTSLRPTVDHPGG